MLQRMLVLLSHSYADLVRDLEHFIVGELPDSDHARCHGVSEEFVRRTRRELERRARSHEIRHLARCMAELRGWDESEAATIIRVLSHAVRDEREALAAIDAEAQSLANVEDGRSAGRAHERQAGAPRSASGTARELGARGCAGREAGTGASRAANSGRAGLREGLGLRVDG